MNLKRILAFLFLFFFCITVNGQKLTFCEQVDPAGKISGASEVFTIGNSGGYFQLMVNMPGEVASDHILFDVYRIDPSTEKELFENSIRVPVDPKWTWFKKEVTFYKAGDYIIYVYNDQDKLISAGKVKIIVQQF